MVFPGGIEDERKPTTERPRKPLPQGYRQGIITAITVLLGFSLSFLHFWGLEAQGEWTWRSIAPLFMLLAAIALQVISLYRALRIEDDDEGEYRKTVTWFIASAVVLLAGLLLAILEVA
jgi:NO-binding membrane sensor protein with MHYT domain